MLFFFRCLLIITSTGMVATHATPDTLKTDLQKATDDYRLSERALNKIEADLANLEKSRYEKTETLNARLKDLGRFISRLYQLKAQSTRWEILISTPPHHYIKSLLIVEQAIVSLERHIKILKVDLDTIQKTATSSAALRQELREKVATYEKRSRDLEQLLKKKEKSLAHDVQRRKTLYTKASKVAAQASTLADLIQQLNSDHPMSIPGSPLPLGAIERPIEGPILVPYGQKHLLNPAGVGTVFRARPGSPVVSPVQGIILFSGPFRTYKNLIILSDEKGSHYVLSGLNRLEASLGQRVMAGDVIARMDPVNKGYLYFEIRSKASSLAPSFRP